MFLLYTCMKAPSILSFYLVLYWGTSHNYYTKEILRWQWGSRRIFFERCSVSAWLVWLHWSVILLSKGFVGSILVREQTWVAHMISGLGVYGRQPMIFLSYLSSLPSSLSKSNEKNVLGWRWKCSVPFSMWKVWDVLPFKVSCPWSWSRWQSFIDLCLVSAHVLSFQCQWPLYLAS